MCCAAGSSRARRGTSTGRSKLREIRPPAVNRTAWAGTHSTVRPRTSRDCGSPTGSRSGQTHARTACGTRPHRLPPDPGVLHSFLSDTSEQAYERLIDTLLDSKHWGEHRGAVLAGCGAIRRHSRHPHRQLPRDVFLSGLGHRGVQQQQAVRRICRRTTCWRSTAQPDPRATRGKPGFIATTSRPTRVARFRGI